MKAFKKITRLLLTLSLLAQLLLIPSFASDAPVYLALGDSISTGYGLSETDPSFVAQLADCYPDFTLVNKAANGNTLSDVYSQIKNGALDNEITNAKLITLTCGGNDLIGTLYQNVAEAYNAKNPTKPITGNDVIEIMAGIQTDTKYYPTKTTLYGHAMTAIKGFAGTLETPDAPATPGTDAFEKSLADYKVSLRQVMDYVHSKNKDVEIVITTQYNPYIVFQDSRAYGRIYSEVEVGVQKLNAVIEEQAAVLDYTVSDVYEAFKNSEENLSNAQIIQDDFPNIDFHPNASGHTVIKDTILALNLVPSFGIHEAKSSLPNGTVAVSLTAVDTPVNVVAAFYNSENRMLGADMVTLSESNLQTTLSAKFTGTASRVQVFLLSNTTFAPLHQALSWSGN